MIRSLSTSAVALIMGAAPVLADLTPAQVWDSLENYYATMGYTVETGQRDESGDTLTVTDITMTPKTEDSTSTMTITVPKMVFQQTGDANVRTIIEGDTLIRSTTTPPGPDAQPVEFQATVSLPDNEMTTSGTPEDMVHQFVYPQAKVEATFDNGDASPMPVTLTLEDVKGKQSNTGGATGEMSFESTAAGVDMTFSAEEPKADDGTGGGTVKGTGRLEDLSVNGTMKMAGEGMNDPQALHLALASGMVLNGSMSMAKSEGSMDFTGTDDDGQPQSGKATYATGETDLTFNMSKDGLGYEGTSKDNAAEMTLASLPFPITYGVAEASGKLMLPIMASDQPQPFTLAYALKDLTLGDAIWGLFDPQAKLPRDPASLEIDLSGNAMVNKDLLDPALAEDMQADAEQPTSGEAGDENTAEEPAMADMPFQPQDLTITRVALDAVGAMADLTGKLTFGDNPSQPVGKIEGSFTGINALLDTLTSMGLMPQEQLMGTRMMLAMFARPSPEDPNVMTTELEFREGGSIFANGQQVK